MNNKPYGWVKNGEYVLYIDKPDSVFNYIPLYTHPSEHDLGIAEAIGFEKGYKVSKPADLTDEEIFEFAKEQYGDAVGLYNHIGFARAILRKAQEK